MDALPPIVEAVTASLTAEAITKALARVFGRRPAPERDQALAAFDDAAAAFFDRYGDRFGRPRSSFLAAQSNWEAVLASTSPAHDLLAPTHLEASGFDGAPPATPQAISDFVGAFHDAAARRPALAPILAAQRRDRRAKDNWDALLDRLDKSALTARPGPAVTDLTAEDRDRWMRYLRSVAERAAGGPTPVALDALTEAHQAGVPLERVPLAEVVARHPALVLVAPPGAGKSEAVRHLFAERALDLAAGPLANSANRVRHAPVLVEPGPGSLFARIAHALHAGGLGGPVVSEGWVREALAEGALWVAVDDAHRLDDTREISDLAAYAPAARVLVLGRDVPILGSLSVPRARVAPLTYHQQVAVLGAHLTDDGPYRPHQALSRFSAADAVRERPLTLSLVALAAESGARDLGDRASLFRHAFRETVAREPHRADALADADVRSRLLGAIALRTLTDPALGYRLSLLDARAALAGALRNLDAEGVRVSVDDALAALRESHALTAAEDGRLSFAHDQWHEFFAAEELVRTRAPLSSVEPADARREVALFAATAPHEPSAEADAFWDNFWHDLTLDNLAVAAAARRAVSAARPRELPRGLPERSHEQIERDYTSFLDVYEAALSRHAPRLRRVIHPHAPGRLGIRLHYAGSGPPGDQNHRAMVSTMFVGLDDPSAPRVSFRDAPPFLDAESGVTRPDRETIYFGSNSPSGIPSRAALDRMLDDIEEAWRERTFWEPDELLRERAFCEGAVLAAALEVDGRSRLGFEQVEVGPLLSALRERPVTADPPSKSSHLWRVGRRAVWGLPDPLLTVATWERTLAELRARSLAADVLHPPVVPPRVVAALPGALLAADEKDALAQWTLGFLQQTYVAAHVLLGSNLPTAAGAVGFYQRFPAVVTFVPEPDAGADSKVYGGSVWTWRSDAADAPLVEVRLAQPGADLRPELVAAGGGSWSSWYAPLGRGMPLYSATYDLIGRDLDAFRKR